MGGGDLNLKKSWHPTTMKNMERVWKAEQKHEAEQKKIEELQKELAEERTREEIRHFAEDQGVVKKKSERLDWMYEGVSALANKEEYLLGRAVDKTFEVIQQAESGLGNKPEDDTLPESIFKPATGNVTIDLANKIREDPLLMIKKQEDENRKKLLDNPIRMKQIADMLKGIHAKKKAKKEKKLSKKKSKSRRRSSSSKNDDDSDEDLRRRHHAKNGQHDSKHPNKGLERSRKHENNDRVENYHRKKKSRDSSSEKVSKTKRNRSDQSNRGIENRHDSSSRTAEHRRRERSANISNRDYGRAHADSRTRKRHLSSSSDSDEQIRDKRKRASNAEGKRENSAFRNKMRNLSREDGRSRRQRISPASARARKCSSSSESSSSDDDKRNQERLSNYKKKGSKMAQYRKDASSRHRKQVSHKDIRANRHRSTSESSSSDDGKRSQKNPLNYKKTESNMAQNHKYTSSKHRKQGSPKEIRASRQRYTSENSSSDSEESGRHKSSHKTDITKKKLHTQGTHNQASLNSKSGKQDSHKNERKRMQSSSSEDSNSDDSNAEKKNYSKIVHKFEEISKGSIPKQYGLIVRSNTSRIKRSFSRSPVKLNERLTKKESSPENKSRTLKYDRDSKSNRSKMPTSMESNYRPEKPSRKLNEAEKEKRLKEMMEDAKLRDAQRSLNLKQHLEEEKKEALLQMKTAGKDFITPILSKVADIGTVADRIKSNIYNIQRTKADLNKNFAKR